MPSKTEEYLALAQRTANGLTRYWESWTDYLTTASRLYKYPFADQLMIYAQRPDATACADYDIWNNRMNRYVRRGSKGIALLDESSGYPRLHYVFDVSDTGVRRNSRDPERWEMNDDLFKPVSEMLTAEYGISHERLSQQLVNIAEKLVNDYWDNNSGDILNIVDGSFFDDYDSSGKELQFKAAATMSVTYTLLERCGFEPEGYFDKDDFQAIHTFSTPDAVYALGAATSDISREVLRKIERTVKTTTRRRNVERMEEYEQQSELHEDRGLPAPEPDPQPAEDPAGQVRQDAPELPEAVSPGTVQFDAPERDAVPASDGTGADGREPDAADDGRTAEAEPGPGQSAEPTDVGAAHEQSESAGRGTGDDGADLQLSFLDANIPTEAQQIEKIDRAESEKTPSAFSLSQSEIENELRRHGSGFAGGKQRIMVLYQTQPDRKLRAKALAKEYGIGGHSHDFLDGSRGFVNHDWKGLEFDHYPDHQKITLKWAQVEKYIDLMIQSDRYLTDEEKEQRTTVQEENGYKVGDDVMVDHPEMVLGVLSTESTQYGREELTVAPIEGANLADQLAEAVQHIEGQYTEVEVETPDIADAENEKHILPADPDVKNFSYTVVDGEVFYRENSVMTQVELSDTAKGRVTGMVELRQTVNDLIDQQLNDYPDEDIKATQERLNAAYDAFTAKYGLLNDRRNGRLFEQDSSYYLLCSLENLDEQGQLKSKAAMFTKRTIRPERTVTSVDTPSEALAVSIGEHGKVDLPYMAELLGTPGEYGRITTELSGVIFKDPAADPTNPEAGWQMADEYLSGDVRAKLRMAQFAAETNPEFAVNVDALTKAQPRELEASEIDVRLGATWLDPDIIQKFMTETFQIPYYLRRAVNVRYSPYTAEWRVEGKTATGRGDIISSETYGTSRANAYKILEETLNLKDVRIYDTIEDAEGKPKRVLNKRETMLAQQKQQVIKDAFANWVWQDPQRRIALVKQYNELFNSTRPREYDGSHIHFVGMNPEITLREHQRNAIAHVLYGGNTLLAHEVGAGKTYEMAASAMEAKRLGLCQKSLFVVPNHLTEQWASEFLNLYPNAKLLVARRKDFETANRKKFCARIATGDYDAVIIGHSQFERIPLSFERQERIIQEQIYETLAAINELKVHAGENFSIKQMEKTRKTLETKLEKLRSDERKDDVITFEQLGVDRLFVDESHFYKNRAKRCA